MTLNLIAKLFLEIVASPSKIKIVLRTLIKQLDVRWMTLNLIAKLFLEIVAIASPLKIKIVQGL